MVGSMRELGVTESYKLKRQVVLSASEAAEMILRVDDSKLLFFLIFFQTAFPLLRRTEHICAILMIVLRAAPRKREGGH